MSLRSMARAAAILLLPLTTVGSQSPGRVLPGVDHHQHLLSPSVAALLAQSVPPPAELPGELNRRFLTEAPRYNDSAGLAEFYTEDAIVAFSIAALFEAVPTYWLRGRHQIAGFLSRAFRNQYTLAPFAYSMNDSTGYIAGYFSGIPRHYDTHLSIRRESDGAWRIAAQSITYGPRPTPQPISADDLVRHLDEAGIRRALVLSLAYMHAGSAVHGENEYARVRAENDWTSRQVARHPERLRGFCSFNPLREYALEEVERCVNDPILRSGLKLHFANSQVDLRNPTHVRLLRAVFGAANARRLPIVAHIWTGNEQSGAPYGRAEAEIFLRELVTAAPDIPIQIAHLAGAGRLDRGSREAIAMFADAVAAGDPRTRNLYFDVTTTVTMETSVPEADSLAVLLRQLGLSRVLYGSDMAALGNVTPKQGWAAFRGILPLTDREFSTIANNVAPYMR